MRGMRVTSGIENEGRRRGRERFEEANVDDRRQICGRLRGVVHGIGERPKDFSEQRFINECLRILEKTLPEKKWKTVSTYLENESLSWSIASIGTGPLRAFLPIPKCNPTVGS